MGWINGDLFFFSPTSSLLALQQGCTVNSWVKGRTCINQCHYDYAPLPRSCMFRIQQADKIRNIAYGLFSQPRQPLIGVFDGLRRELLLLRVIDHSLRAHSWSEVKEVLATGKE